MSSVCVVVPTLDRPDLLSRCVRSVLSGERSPDQLVVCDQSAGPLTEQAVRRIAKSSAVEYIRLERAHASMARNAGLHASRTSLVAFIDDDCVADPRWLSALASRYARAETGESVAAVCGRVLPLREGNSARKHAVSSRNSPYLRYFRRGKSGSVSGSAFPGWAPWDAGTGGNMLAPRATLLAIGGFDARLGPGSPGRAGEDIDLLYRLSERGTLVYEPAAAVRHPMQNRGGRLRRRLSYGQGMGSMLGLHIRGGDGSARGLLMLYVRHQIANAARRGVWGTLESTLHLAGAGYALLRVLLETRVGR